MFKVDNHLKNRFLSKYFLLPNINSNQKDKMLTYYSSLASNFHNNSSLIINSMKTKYFNKLIFSVFKEASYRKCMFRKNT